MQQALAHWTGQMSLHGLDQAVDQSMAQSRVLKIALLPLLLLRKWLLPYAAQSQAVQSWIPRLAMGATLLVLMAG